MLHLKHFQDGVIDTIYLHYFLIFLKKRDSCEEVSFCFIYDRFISIFLFLSCYNFLYFMQFVQCFHRGQVVYIQVADFVPNLTQNRVV